MGIFIVGMPSGLKGSSPKKPAVQNPNMQQQWEQFCLTELHLDANTASDAFVIYSNLSNLKKFDRDGGELSDYIGQSGRHCLRRLGVFFHRGSGKTGLKWDIVQRYLDLLPAPKQG